MPLPSANMSVNREKFNGTQPPIRTESVSTAEPWRSAETAYVELNAVQR